MGKTSMFGGQVNSATLPSQPSGSRLKFNSKVEDVTADSCFSVKGSSICQSPSPTNKNERFTGAANTEPFSLGFLERMA